MHSHLAQMLAAERTRELRDAAASTRKPRKIYDDASVRRPRGFARLRIRVARLTTRFAETRP